MEIEFRGTEQVEEVAQTAKPRDLFFPWFAGNVSVFGISYGAFFLSYGISFWQAVLASFIGITFSFLLVGIASLPGKKGSAPAMVLSRVFYGIKGTIPFSIISWMYVVGWEIVLLSMAASAIEPIFERLGFTNVRVVTLVSVFVIAAIIIFTTFIGYKLIMKMQKFITFAAIILTLIYVALTYKHISFSEIAIHHKDGSVAAFIATTIFAIIGIGIGWVAAAPDFTRYQPKSTSSSKIILWTMFAGGTPVFLLSVYGGLLAGSDSNLFEAIIVNPIGALTNIIPLWFAIPFAVLTIIGLVSGIIMDIYTSSLAFITIGVKIKRPVQVLIDGTIMILGAIYILFFAPNFLTVFQDFLATMGVLILSWAGIFIAHSLFDKDDYDSYSLYNGDGKYGIVNLETISISVISIIIGLGFATSSLPFLQWEGYYFKLLGLVGTEWYQGNFGCFLSLIVSFFGYMIVRKKGAASNSVETGAVSAVAESVSVPTDDSSSSGELN
jgi:purine-cytosine permease-like protein